MPEPDLDPALRAARFMPRGLFGDRSHRWLIPIYRAMIGLMRLRAPFVDLSEGQRLYLFRPTTPAATPLPALLWIHGGGLVIGAPAIDAEFCAEIAERLGILVAAPSYRLAPDHRYPAAHNDLRAAFATVASMMDVDPRRIAIGGDSAGGGLAAALAAGLCAEDGPRPAFLLLHEPMLDEATRAVTGAPQGARIWSATTNRIGWDAYLGRDMDPVPPTASAPRADDDLLSRFPPTWIGVGTADLFHAECAAFAERLAKNGVATEFVEAKGAFHGFNKAIPKATVTKTYMSRMQEALAKGLGVLGA